jgi:small subunit ribosomal protein S8
MVNDHLSDFVTRIRNGYKTRAKTLETDANRRVEKVAEVLQQEGYLKAVKKEGGKLMLTLKYDGKEPALTGIVRVSKPGARIYTRIKKVPPVLGGLGITILTTPKGIMSNRQAKKLNAGGEIIARVW